MSIRLQLSKPLSERAAASDSVRGVRRRVLVVILFVGCATAHQESHDDEIDAAVQTPVDAPRATADAAAPTNACAFSGVLATYSFTGATGTQAQTPATTTATGMIAGPITRAATLTAVSGATSINSSNWPIVAQLDTTKYYAFTLTPPAGCKLSLTSAAIDAKASSTGPMMASLATSSDSYAAKVALATSAPSAPALAIADATTAVEIRIYGYGATSTGGTFRLQNTVTVTGSLK
jgi:hypothetical protein